VAPADALDLARHLPPAAGLAVVRDGATTLVAAGAAEVVVASGADAFAALRRVGRGGFWTGFLSYDLGRSVERVRPRARDELGLPDLVLARFDARLALRPGAEPTVEGTGPARRLLEQARWRARRTERRPARSAPATGAALVSGPWRSSLSRGAHAAAVCRVLALLSAGDCYQVNVTRRLRARCAADPRDLAAAVWRANPAPHAALLGFGDALPGLAIVSASPELFLARDGAAVTTRPIKGTARDAGDLVASAKDRAENVMIVDLARNDLGRVCRPGSIRVGSLCAVEAHPGLHHLVSTVHGVLDPGVGLDGLVRATFPPASVTGAPKPRVMQVIEDLEPVRRGVYCGALGWIDADRERAELSVAIRTLVATGRVAHYGVGGGIVADSRPAGEWDETVLKARRVIGALSPDAADGLGDDAARDLSRDGTATARRAQGDGG
jgi:para-aminobenzoate synthetase component 1